jgi:hypothetical protein
MMPPPPPPATTPTTPTTHRPRLSRKRRATRMTTARSARTALPFLHTECLCSCWCSATPSSPPPWLRWALPAAMPGSGRWTCSSPGRRAVGPRRAWTAEG